MRNAIVALVLKFRALSKMQRGLLLGLAAVLCFLLLGQAGGPHLKRTSPPIAEFQQTENWPSAPSISPDSLVDDEKQKDLREAQKESAVSRVELGNRLASAAMPYATPLMAHRRNLLWRRTSSPSRGRRLRKSWSGTAAMRRSCAWRDAVAAAYFRPRCEFLRRNWALQ